MPTATARTKDARQQGRGRTEDARMQWEPPASAAAVNARLRGTTRDALAAASLNPNTYDMIGLPE
eukprot:7979345-Pyramimonas_sp.AAC.1